MSSLPDPSDRPLLSVDEARHALGDVAGRSAFYRAVQNGGVPGVVRLGRRVLLSTAALRQWVGLDAHTNGATTNGDGTVERE
jgi:predicted DNA-binding transcriptional regulator AlpA